MEVNRRLVERYFTGEREALERDEVKKMCERLFTGRQKDTIKKPLDQLCELQKKMLR